MSQKSPNHPKSPVSNSPNCDEIESAELEENQRPRSALDRLQRQVEEELRQSNRLLVAIDGLIAESKGSISRNYSRPTSAQNDGGLNQKTSSRISLDSEICSSEPLVESTYNEEMVGVQQPPPPPPPPHSAITYGSRDQDGPREGSKRGTRFSSPEKISLRSRAKSPSPLTNQDASNIDYRLAERICQSTFYLPPEKNSKVLNPCPGNSSRTSHHTFQEQPHFDESKSSSKKNFKRSLSRYLNESSECQAQPLSCNGRGARAFSPLKDIMMAESSQNHHGTHSMSPANWSDIQSPTFEELRSVKVRNDYHHSHESPHDFFWRDEKTTAALGHLSQLKKTPSYFGCGLQQGTEFLNVCCPKTKDASRTGEKITRLPKSPCLKADDIDDLIKCETKDVESAWYLTSDEKKKHKKPCPKQQKAQMTVKSIVQSYSSQSGGPQIYAPLEHPEPEDISPEVAAAMMFSQEQGIRMEECPNAIIAHLFPDESKFRIPEKGSVSVVDRNQKDQEEMFEKSAAVPSEGVSDSAYTRIMRDKGEDMKLQRMYDMDFAICQSKPEYVLVSQKPQRINKVQFRGNSPAWFPGYFSAFPDDEGLKVVSSPSGIFHKAWVHSNPKNIPASDLIVLE